jgi:hypothetical protein
MPLIDINGDFFLNLFFKRTIEKIRVLRIKNYKSKKVKVEPEKSYHMHFKLAIRDKTGTHVADEQVFDVHIPANGYFIAKKKLERFVLENIDVEIINFEAEPIEEQNGNNHRN